MSKKSDRGTKRPKISPVHKDREPSAPIEKKDCGCREQAFDDGTVDAFPCVPHAMQKAAASLQDAGNALGYIGHTLAQTDERNRAMAILNDEVDEGIEKGDIE